MADRGYDITEDLALRGTLLCIPPFMNGKSQLSQRKWKHSQLSQRKWKHQECSQASGYMWNVLLDE